MTSKKAHPAAARGQLARQLRRLGHEVPQEWRDPPPVVTWRARGCRCWLLHVYLTPAGWVLDGRDFHEPLDRWIARENPDGTRTLDDGTPMTLETYRANRWGAMSPREVEGVSGEPLPLDIGSWGGASFEVGCDHGSTSRPLADVAADCAKFRAERKHVLRPVELDTAGGMTRV